MKAQQLINLLAARHQEDIFIPECKNGPSMYGEHLRMDALAIKKSWQNPMTICYEVKVSRSDFMRDEKWRGYLPYCNEFYFVVPPKLILPDEVPEGAGLIVSSLNATKLYKKKKASYRDVAIPIELYKYILFSRAKIIDENIHTSSEEHWENWLKEKDGRSQLGWLVSKKIQQYVRELENERNEALRKAKDYEDFKSKLEAMGLDVDKSSQWSFKNDIEELLGALPTSLKRDVNDAIDGLKTVQKFLEERDAA